MTIKKGDTVFVLTGKDKGKKGPVEKSLAESSRVVVSGVNMQKRHLKPSKTRPKGGISEFAAPMDRSKVMLVCPHCSKPTRIKVTLGEDGKKYRSCLHCQASLDSK